MSRLSLNLLGAFCAKLDETPADGFDYDKVRALLAYLAVESDRAHRRDRLAALLWPDQDRRHALQSLSQALYTLRLAIDDHNADPPFLLIKPRTLQFNRASDHWLDTTTLTDALESVRNRQLGTSPDGEGDLNCLRKAVEDYRGDFLAGVAFDGCPDYEEWLVMQRERYRRGVGELLRLLVEGYEGLEESSLALGFAADWLALDPWQEESHRAIIRILAADGQTTAALAQFERCRRILADELGVVPSAETVTLVDRIRRRRAGDGGAQTRLPAMLTPLIGREEELIEIRRLVQEANRRLICLTGPGGSGKTALAIAAASSLAHQYADGVAFVALAPLDSVQGIVPAIAQAVGYAFRHESDTRQQLFDYLRPREMLLVMDNFEHLIAGATVVTELLQTADGIAVLATSRAALNAPQEHLLPVKGLPIPESAPGDVEITGERTEAAKDGSAVTLFLHHVQRRNPDFAPSQSDEKAIIEVCRQVAGMPLAILLAASWGDVLSPSQIASRLAQEPDDQSSAGIDLLTVDWQTLPERQRSMRTVLAQSWVLLSEADQRTLAALAVFRGSFSSEAARRVAGASLKQVRVFVEKSLVQRDGEDRYTIHELLRQYAAERLIADPNWARQAHDRHSQVYAEAVQSWDLALRGKGQKEALQAFAIDIDNVRAAWRHVVEAGATSSIEQMLDGVYSFYEWRSRYETGLTSCRQAIDQISEHSSEHDSEQGVETELVLAQLEVWQGFFQRMLGDVQAATRSTSSGLKRLDRLERTGKDVRIVRAVALYRMGQVAVLDDRDGAESLWRQSLLLFRQAGDHWWKSQVEDAFGMLFFNRGQFEEGLRLLESSLATRRLLDDRRGMAHALRNIGEVYGTHGRIEDSLFVLRESIDLYEQLGDRYGAATSRFESATKLMYSGRFSEVTSLLEKAVERVRSPRSAQFPCHCPSYSGVELHQSRRL